MHGSTSHGHRLCCQALGFLPTVTEGVGTPFTRSDRAGERPKTSIGPSGVSGMLFYAVNRSAGEVHILEMLTVLGILALPSIATSF
ncbi:Broad Substrate Specificity Atp-Binding Cassette Transporter Abcg2 [Manis pentadactyla]|nr:Broad Substrate Specificity Atp-Binding Cassette Transporter Abcg2 [Manis pentadactyla]